MGKTLFKEDRLRMLRQMLSYPCRDVRTDAERMIIEEYGSKALEEQEKLRVVVPKNWGIRKVDFQKLSKNTLEQIYYGAGNLWVPTEMLDLEHPEEIVANYLGAGALKRYNAHLSNEQIPKRSFSELVKFMNRAAYDGFIDFAKQSHSYKRREFPIAEQSNRLALLSREVKGKFCASFWKGYKSPEYDPRTRNGYVDAIYRHFENRFKREH